MRKLLMLIVLVTFSVQAQTNLIDDSTWAIGAESPDGFNNNGTDAENNFENGQGPYGQTELLWSVYPDESNGSDGGWITDYISFDSSKTYRFTLWIKKTGTNNGTNYFGLISDDGNGQNTTLSLNNNVANAYFFAGDLPEFGKWYLLVGFVHGSGYNLTINEGGLYDIAGTKLTNTTDFKFATSALNLRQRIYSNGNLDTDRVYLFDPALYEVNGQEPTIQQLISGTGSTDTQSPTSPTVTEMTHTETTVDLSWSGSTDNVGVTGYKVYKDGVLHVSLGNQTLYQAKSLSPGTTYDFEVSAIDGQGNESSRSNVVSVTTDSSSGGGGGTTDPIWAESNGVASYNGNVAIGATTVPSGYALAVDGKIISEEVKVQLSGNWPDYVFKEDYKLPTLEEIKKHIEETGHLPKIPSAKEVEANGVDVGEMNRLLLEKIEELTLFVIQLKEENAQIKNNYKMVSEQIEALNKGLTDYQTINK